MCRSQRYHEQHQHHDLATDQPVARFDGSPDVRVSQRERDLVIEALRQHIAEGRLDVDEFGDRVEEALAAKTRAELRETLRYLPALPNPPRPRRPLLSRAALIVALVVGVLGVVGLMAAFTPFGFAFHPAFFWVAPFVAMKLLHVRRHHWRRAESVVRV
ncbi:MAG: DUF1707 SHOCT-like domain-containing protein [Acidimicrobiales bacterium]